MQTLIKHPGAVCAPHGAAFWVFGTKNMLLVFEAAITTLGSRAKADDALGLVLTELGATSTLTMDFVAVGQCKYDIYKYIYIKYTNYTKYTNYIKNTNYTKITKYELCNLYIL